jgi:hypothetical protein
MALVDNLAKLKAIADGLPAEQKAAFIEALQGMDSDGDGAPDVKGMKSFFFKDGKFSKTAAFFVLGNSAVLVTYLLQSWLGGAQFDLGFLKGSIPTFDWEAAAAVSTLLSGSYIGNNLIKSKTPAATEE